MLTDKDKKKLKTRKVFDVTLVSRVMGVDRRTARKWLIKHNALNDEGKTTPELLKRSFPDVYAELEDEAYIADDDEFRKI